MCGLFSKFIRFSPVDFFIHLHMLDKLNFNNLVIKTKKEIQKSRTQTIQKLVQKIRKQKSILEKKENDVRNRDRLRRSTECLLELKKLKSVELMKRILVLEKTPEIILTDGRSTPEEIALAMLATNKNMQEIIKTFKKALKLNEDDPNWKAEIAKPSKRRVKRDKTEEKRKKRKEVKEQKALERKRLEWIKNNQSSDKETPLDDEEHIKSQNGIWKVEKVQEDLPIEVENDQNIKTEKAINYINQNVKTTNSKKVLNKSAKQVESKPKKLTNAETSASVTHVIDPFFITGSGDNYLSTVVVAPNNETKEENEIGNKRIRNDRKRTNRETVPIQKRTLSAPTNKTNFSKLHPSWEAKLKTKPFISNFQGKIMTFDDFNENEKNETIKPVVNYKTEMTKKTQGSLHPSWEAKLKQKPTITTFCGKKTTFHVDDE